MTQLSVSPSSLSDTSPRSAAADVQLRLARQIEAGEYKQSERLPSEAELAKQHGVSRPVIREALMRLQALGLTASRTGKGTYVVSDRVSVPMFMGLYSPAHISEVRRQLEIPAARLAAERRSDGDIGELAAILARMLDADDPAKRNRLDASFHIAIARASGNPLIVKLVENLRSILEEHSLAAARAPYRRREAGSEHTRIYEAIVRRDAEAAGKAMAEHLDGAERSFAPCEADGAERSFGPRDGGPKA